MPSHIPNLAISTENHGVAVILMGWDLRNECKSIKSALSWPELPHRVVVGTKQEEGESHVTNKFYLI